MGVGVAKAKAHLQRRDYIEKISLYSAVIFWFDDPRPCSEFILSDLLSQLLHKGCHITQIVNR